MYGGIGRPRSMEHAVLSRTVWRACRSDTAMSVASRTVFVGDDLPVLRGMEAESVDMCGGRAMNEAAKPALSKPKCGNCGSDMRPEGPDLYCSECGAVAPGAAELKAREGTAPAEARNGNGEIPPAKMKGEIRRMAVEAARIGELVEDKEDLSEREANELVARLDAIDASIAQIKDRYGGVERPNQAVANASIKTDPERHPDGIMPAPYVKQTKRKQGELLPLGHHTSPGPCFAAHAPGQDYLPGMEPEGTAEPAVMLALFDQFGGPLLAMHAWIEALLSIPIADRDGQQREITGSDPLSVREVVVDWFQWKPMHYRERGKRTGLILAEALMQMNRILIPINKRGGFYMPVIVEAASGWSLNDRIVLFGRIEPDGKTGPQINRAMLRYLRTKSEPAYRAYLSLCFEWDRYGTTTDAKARIGRKRKLILHDRPEVLRNAAGYVLDAKGRIVTNRRGEPDLSAFNPRAVRTGAREPNPARDRYPSYDAADLVRLCFPLKVFDDSDARRSMRARARRAIETLESIGGCTIERCGHKPRDGRLPWRVMPARRV